MTSDLQTSVAEHNKKSLTTSRINDHECPGQVALLGAVLPAVTRGPGLLPHWLCHHLGPRVPPLDSVCLPADEGRVLGSEWPFLGPGLEVEPTSTTLHWPEFRHQLRRKLGTTVSFCTQEGKKWFGKPPASLSCTRLQSVFPVSAPMTSWPPSAKRIV